jgi:O-antigen/teichoic acid export membrane protein
LLTSVAWILPWGSILNHRGFDQIPLVVVSIWITLFTALFSLVRVVYSAYQVEFKLAPAMLAGLLISFGLAVAGIHRGWPVTVVITASLTSNLLGLAFGLFLLPVGFSRNKRWPKRLYREGLWFFVIEICTVLIFGADIFLVNLLAGSGQAAVFALHAQLFLYIQTGISLLVAPYWASFGEAWQGGDRDWLRTSVRRLVAATAVLSCIGVFLLMMFGRTLMGRWSHGQIAWNPLLALLIGANVVIQGVGGVYATTLGAAGIAREPARVVVFQAVMNAGVCIWAIRRFGVTGAATGSLVTYVLTSGLYLPWKVRQAWKIKHAWKVRQVIA